MKIIDLLNKKMNNEEIPKKFKYDNEIFVYDIEENDYIYEIGNASFFNEYCSPIYNFEDLIDTLNDEVEIIEEHKIPEKLDQTLNRNDIGKDYYKYIMENRFKVNEIIDYLKENK